MDLDGLLLLALLPILPSSPLDPASSFLNRLRLCLLSSKTYYVIFYRAAEVTISHGGGF